MATYPSEKPREKIDYILCRRRLRAVEEAVLERPSPPTTAPCWSCWKVCRSDSGRNRQRTYRIEACHFFRRTVTAKVNHERLRITELLAVHMDQ